MRWRLFSTRPKAAARDATWWDAADAQAAAPRAETIAALRLALEASHASADEREDQEEMLDGLERLLEIARSPVPIALTQHRVIGSDTCHLVIPATTVGEESTSGKIFLTSTRLVFAGTGTGVRSEAWHRVRRVVCEGRILRCEMTSGAPGHAYQCNTFGDALAIAHLTTRLVGRGTLPS